MTLEINKQFTIDAPVERVWSILADDFEHVYDWATGLDSSGPNPKAPRQADGNAGGRVCEVPGFGFTDERVVTYDPERHTIAYSVDAEKVPGFVHDLTNRWTLRSHGASAGAGTAVTMRLSADVTGPLGAIMKPMMRRRFDKLLSAVTTDLTVYAETGKVSDGKARELASQAA
ncbi:MAG: SRPBCC family protein [Actinomycetota bacterium]